VRGFWVKLHRYVSLACAAFWLVQALTGVLLVYRLEIYDALIPGAHKPWDMSAIEQAVGRLEQENPGWTRDAIWASGSGRDRFDIVLDAPKGSPSEGKNRYWRVDGAGHVLQIGPVSEDGGGSHFFNTLTHLHYTLLLGDIGRWIVAISGGLLISNLVIALKVAWPRPGQAMKALTPSTRGNLRAKLFSWHRAAGLWLAVPAILMVTFGIGEAFEDEINNWLGVHPSGPEAGQTSSGQTIGLNAAVKVALPLYPSASISGIGFPTRDTPWYTVTLRQPAEPVKAYGRTKVWVGLDGHVLKTRDPLKASAAEQFTRFLYPAHTGEAFGPLGRVIALLIGLWLIGMGGLGVAMWVLRHRQAGSRTKA
jgi:uncharacterized iron-regulated membrane protein